MNCFDWKKVIVNITNPFFSHEVEWICIVEALRNRLLAKTYSTMERQCMRPVSGSELGHVTYLTTY